jgi:hypothetical protein
MKVKDYVAEFIRESGLDVDKNLISVQSHPEVYRVWDCDMEAFSMPTQNELKNTIGARVRLLLAENFEALQAEFDVLFSKMKEICPTYKTMSDKEIKSAIVAHYKELQDKEKGDSDGQKSK